MSNPTSKPIPIILCVQQADIAHSIKEALLPEYEVIHTCPTPQTAALDIPTLFRGRTPPSNDSIGTMNYNEPPAAVLVILDAGNGFDEGKVAEVREACAGVSFVPWITVGGVEGVREALGRVGWGRDGVWRF